MVSSSFKVVLVELSGEVEIFSIFVDRYVILDATVSTYPPNPCFGNLIIQAMISLKAGIRGRDDLSCWKPSGLPDSTPSSRGLS